MSADCGYCGESGGVPTEAERCTLCDECEVCGARDDLRGTTDRLCEQCDDERQAGEARARELDAQEACWDARIDEWKDRRYDRT